MTKTENKRRLEKLGFWVALISGAIGILVIIPNTRDFIRWIRSMKYVELDASFPNEKWRKASNKDFIWLEGSWKSASIIGSTTNFKIEKNKLFRQNIVNEIRGIGQDLISEWEPIEIHISDRGILRFSYPKNEDWYLNFIRKDDNCSFYENERYVDNGGSFKSTDGRKFFNVNHTEFSNDGMIYDCK